MGDVLNLLRDENYQWGRCVVLNYDRTRLDIFPEGYLSKLYWLTKASGRRAKMGTLPDSFCSMSDLSHDNVTAYLSTRNPLLILSVVNEKGGFDPAGYAFFPVVKGTKPGEKFAFGAYSFFSDWWGRPEITTLAMLGMGYFFREFGLSALLGERYATNDRTARFMRQFGFRDIGTISRYLMRDGRLVPGVVSECLVEDFERAAEDILNRLLVEARDGQGVTE